MCLEKVHLDLTSNVWYFLAAEYQLLAFVSHMGTSTQSGHYVAHVRKDDRWVIFNDCKVALSGDPPKDMGYLYFFQRMSSFIYMPGKVLKTHHRWPYPSLEDEILEAL